MLQRGRVDIYYYYNYYYFVFYSEYIQYISTGVPLIFRVMFLLQE
jgi:hypothetical protein